MTNENKTRLSVGCILYDNYYREYIVEKITPLSDELIQIDVFNKLYGTLICVMRNNKYASVGYKVPEDGASPYYIPLYLHKQSVKEDKERRDHDELCQTIGGVVIQLSEIIKEATGRKCHNKR